MTIHFIENILVRIRERKISYENRLFSGAIEGFEEYKGIVGKLHGLQEAEEEIKYLYKQMYETVSVRKNEEFPNE